MKRSNHVRTEVTVSDGRSPILLRELAYVVADLARELYPNRQVTVAQHPCNKDFAFVAVGTCTITLHLPFRRPKFWIHCTDTGGCAEPELKELPNDASGRYYSTTGSPGQLYHVLGRYLKKYAGQQTNTGPTLTDMVRKVHQLRGIAFQAEQRDAVMSIRDRGGRDFDVTLTTGDGSLSYSGHYQNLKLNGPIAWIGAIADATEFGITHGGQRP